MNLQLRDKRREQGKSTTFRRRKATEKEKARLVQQNGAGV
jgi:hypothetical protein